MKNKLQAYVLMESVMAMVVVMLCFGIAMAIINNVTTGSRGQLKLQASIRLAEEAVRCKRDQAFLDESVSSEAFRIEKKFIPWRNSSVLYQMNLKAIAPDGKILANYDEIFRKP